MMQEGAFTSFAL